MDLRKLTPGKAFAAREVYAINATWAVFLMENANKMQAEKIVNETHKKHEKKRKSLRNLGNLGNLCNLWFLLFHCTRVRRGIMSECCEKIKETCDEIKIKSGLAGHFTAPRYQ